MSKVLITGLFFFSGMSMAGGPAGGNPYYDIRIYCEYRDADQGKDLTFKLINPDNTTVKFQNSMFIRHVDNVRYTVGEPHYSDLVKKCEEKINEKTNGKGKFLSLKGTNANVYEIFSWYYPVKVN